MVEAPVHGHETTSEAYSEYFSNGDVTKQVQKAVQLSDFIRYSLFHHSPLHICIKDIVYHSALTVPEWSPTSVLGKPNDA